MTLEHQTALITGASGSIGGAIAASLADAGARVVLLGRNTGKLETVRARLPRGAETAIVLSCDVTDREQVEIAVRKAQAEAGAIDIVVCGAGINVTQRSLRSLEPADWDRMIATNLTGAFNVLHFVLPAMRERGRGLIVQLSSLSGMRASMISGAAYSASKFGQAALGICIGREERGRGIRSTVIYPGEVDTSFLDTRSSRPGGVSQSRREMILKPEDVAAAVRFVAELPERAHVPMLVLKPSVDDFA